MFNWTLEYTLSQILIIIAYILICITYFLRSRKSILVIDIMAYISQAISFFLLNGLTRVAMNFVCIFRNVFFVVDDRDRKSNVLNKRDYIILSILIMIIVVLTMFTYNGFGSLLSVFATILSTISVWQKKTKYYKLLGIPVSMTWLGYHIFLKSIFAIILESILFVSTVTGYMLETKRSK